MSNFREQLESIGSALLIIERLPENTIWALEVTEADDAEHPTVLNIFTPQDTWIDLRMRLKLGTPSDTDKLAGEFESYRSGDLLVSFIHHEEETEQ